MGTAFLVAVGYGLVAPVLPVLARSFGVSVTATSALISAFAVARIAFAPLSGQMVARLGEVPVLCAGLLIVGASSAACAAATDFASLLGFRTVGGVGSTFFTVSSDLILIRVSPRKVLGRVSSAWSGAFLIGGVAGPAIGAALSPWGLRVPFAAYSGVLLLAAVVAAVRLRGRVGTAKGQRTDSSTITFRDACRVRSFRAALSGNFLEGWTDHGLRLVLVPVVVTEVIGKTTLWTGVALTAFAVGTLVGLPLGGWLADVRNRRLPALLGSAALAGTAVWLGASTTVVGLLIAAAASGVGTGVITPPVNSAVGDLISGSDHVGRSGSAMAGFQMTGDVGAVVGPLVVGAVFDLAGNVAAFGTAAVVAGVSFLVWLQVSERRGG